MIEKQFHPFANPLKDTVVTCPFWYITLDKLQVDYPREKTIDVIIDKTIHDWFIGFESKTVQDTYLIFPTQSRALNNTTPPVSSPFKSNRFRIINFSLLERCLKSDWNPTYIVGDINNILPNSNLLNSKKPVLFIHNILPNNKKRKKCNSHIQK